MDAARWLGGSIKLLELAQKHPAELAYDFRSRFGVNALKLGVDIQLDEAVLLVSILQQDPTSWLSAAIQKWKYPVSHEWILGRNTYDLLAMANSKKKPKPYPTPWKGTGAGTLGKAGQDPEEVKRRLDAMNNRKAAD